MSVRLRWAGHVSYPFPFEQGTWQGGLTSPFLFNVFYKELIDALNGSECGICIDGQTYNAFCYADDVLLASTTPSGLQSLIDRAAELISNQGLRFNPSKTTCMLFSRNPFTVSPSWSLGGASLRVEDGMTYLGASLSCDDGSRHVQNRQKAAYRAFYALQNAHLHFGGCKPEVASHIFAVGVQTVLFFG